MAWELTPWKPFRDLERMRGEMDRLWDSFFETEGVKRKGDVGTWMPNLDLSETKNEIIVKAEIPGLDPKDIDISLSEGVLTIKGEKKQEKEEKDSNFHLVERSYGSFTRLVRLPKEVKGEKISASYKDGVLKITLPKSEEAKKKEIKIRVE
ncbi:MAG TPA: Hsp20/alpha crystallin family protein [Thermodesulfobacteriota bacterium]|nr:Hsp20/alpha crystallin family protein [Thermodesulfobacteriota bacterium]